MSKVRWTGNNTRDVSQLLQNFTARAEPDGARLHLVGIGLNTHISVGDTLEIDGSRLGITRSRPAPVVDKFVTWEGENVFEIDDFVKLYGVNLQVVAERLNIYAGPELMASLGRGDRITKSASGQIVISRAGEHHRV